MALQHISLGSIENWLSYDDTGTYSDGTPYGLKMSSSPSFAAITATDNITLDADNKSIRFGADQDATILYDGTNLVVNPRAVGSGKMSVSGAINTTEHYQVDGTQVLTNQQAAIASLTDSSGGTADNTIAALPDLADTPLTADALRDDIMTNWLPVLLNNFADLAAKYNALAAMARAHGLIAT